MKTDWGKVKAIWFAVRKLTECDGQVAAELWLDGMIKCFEVATIFYREKGDGAKAYESAAEAAYFRQARARMIFRMRG